MEHENAISTHAAERYIIGEMDDAEATAFEAHLFDCRICAQDVRDTSLFAGSAREAFRKEPKLEPRPWYGRLQIVLPYAAILLLGVTVMYQAIGPGQSTVTSPQVVKPTIMRVVRAAPPVVQVPTGQDTFLMVIDVHAPDELPRYSLIFRTAEGEDVVSLEADSPDAGSLHVLLPSKRFPDGDYTMVLRGISLEGGEGETLEEYRFRVSHQESAG